MNSLGSTLATARRDALRQWLESHHEGSQTSFARSTGINPGELSLLLRNRAIGERRAAAIERLAGMPEGYLVNPLPVGEQSAPVEGALKKDEAELLRRYRQASAEARRILLAAARAT